MAIRRTGTNAPSYLTFGLAELVLGREGSAVVTCDSSAPESVSAVWSGFHLNDDEASQISNKLSRMGWRLVTTHEHEADEGGARHEFCFTTATSTLKNVEIVVVEQDGVQFDALIATAWRRDPPCTP